MKKNVLLAVSLMGSLVFLNTACVKDNRDGQSPPVGSEIVFSAATSYSNQGGTRAVYSGETYTSGASEYERIDWENNDRVKINYVAGQTSNGSEYKVTGISAANEKSTADVEAVGDKLVWEGGASHKFYAMYPTASGGNHPNDDASLTGATVAGVLSKTQNVSATRIQEATLNGVTYNKYLPDMKYAYMVGYKETNSPVGRVTIPFTPAVTAFNFIFKATSQITVTSFELISNNNYLTGYFEFDIDGGDERGATWSSVTPKKSNKKTISVSFGTNGITLVPNQNEYLDFTVFTLPIAQSGLTIKFHCKDNNGYTYTKTLELKDKTTGDWHTFAAGKKHVVTNFQLAGETVTYTFSLASNTLSYTSAGGPKDYKITSYKTIGNQTFPVSWQATEYSTDNGTTWNTWPTNALPSNLKRFTASGAGSTSAQAYNAELTASPRECTNTTYSLGTKASKGTEDNPYDLSTKGGSANRNTANCYVIDAPGWYCFPMVYGNGIKNGEVNTDAFDPTDRFVNNQSNVLYNYLNCLVDHTNASISSPYIDDAYSSVGSPVLLWQDSKSLIQEIGSIVRDSHKYVKFYVSPATINQGNAVIAVKSGSDIAWSWHIWVTHVNMASVTVRNKSFMQVNLGWCGELSYKNNNTARSLKVKFVQAETSNQVILTLSQSAGTASGTTTFHRTSPHYQWGRKDPFVPPMGLGSGNSNNYTGNKTVYDYNNIVIDGISIASSGQHASIGTAIKQPTTMWPTGDSDWVDWLDRTRGYLNLWNHTQTAVVTSWANSSGNRVVDKTPSAHGKTIYDPCPEGYTVPLARDFEDFPDYEYPANTGGTSFCKKNTYDHTFDKHQWSISDNGWPVLGQRSRLHSSVSMTDDQYGHFGEYGYFFTSVAHGYVNPNTNNLTEQNRIKVKNAIFIQLTGTSITMTQGPKAAALSIRCVKE